MNILRIFIVFAGVYALFNFVLAGYGFMSAGGEPGKIAAAWNKIWQTALGLLVVVGAFILGSIFGYLLYGNPNQFFQIVIYGP